MQKKKSGAPFGEDMTADTMELEWKKRKQKFLNLERGIFEGKLNGGLNQSKSVFDQTAVFQVRNSK